MLPLTNRDTLTLLGLRLDHLKEVCSFSTRFIRHVLERTLRAPARRAPSRPGRVRRVDALPALQVTGSE
jgi:hypothetical protein